MLILWLFQEINWDTLYKIAKKLENCGCPTERINKNRSLVFKDSQLFKRTNWHHFRHSANGRQTEKNPDQLAFSAQKAQWLCWTALDHETCEISAGVLALPGFGKAGSIAQNSLIRVFWCCQSQCQQNPRSLRQL